MKCDKRFTGYTISGLVKAKYCKLPMTCLYYVGSQRGLPELREILGIMVIGDVTGLASDILVRRKRSWIYLRCIRGRPRVVRVASIPRKYPSSVGSFSENCWDNTQMNWSTSLQLLHVTIISSTYTKKYNILSSVIYTKEDVSARQLWNRETFLTPGTTREELVSTHTAPCSACRRNEVCLYQQNLVAEWHKLHRWEFSEENHCWRTIVWSANYVTTSCKTRWMVRDLTTG